MNSLSFVAANADILSGTFAPALEAPTCFSVIFESPASVVIDGCFRVNDIKILSGDNGLFIGMPSKKRGDINRDIAHPLNQETRDKFVKAILEEYEKTE